MGLPYQADTNIARSTDDNKLADSLITDTNADLNVYLETGVDGTAKAASDDGPSDLCCGIVTKDETAASCQAGQGKCCTSRSTEEDSAHGGCGGCDGGQLGDLNKWAGRSSIPPNKLSI